MALTTANAAGLVSGPAATASPQIVKVRLLRAIRHEGKHTEAGTVLEVGRPQAIDLVHMAKAYILMNEAAVDELPPAEPVTKPAGQRARRAAPDNHA